MVEINPISNPSFIKAGNKADIKIKNLISVFEDEIKTPDFEKRSSALIELITIARKTTPSKGLDDLKKMVWEPLIKALKNDSKIDVRILAAKALLVIDEKNAVPYLLKALKDPKNYKERWTLERMIKDIDPKNRALANELINIFQNDKNPDEKHSALVYFNSIVQKMIENDGEISADLKKASFEPIRKLLRDNSDKNVRMRASEALVSIDKEEAVPYLLEAIDDPKNRDIRQYFMHNV